MLLPAFKVTGHLVPFLFFTITIISVITEKADKKMKRHEGSQFLLPSELFCGLYCHYMEITICGTYTCTFLMVCVCLCIYTYVCV